MEFKIYHNPRCSKSRQALEILENNNINPEIKKYLEEGLTEEEVKELSKFLGKDIIDFVRTKEELFKEINIDWQDQEQAARALSENPKLLERPIVVRGKEAVIGRPPENIHQLLN